MRAFKPSLAPRRNRKNSFLPAKLPWPMPAAKARLTTMGTLVNAPRPATAPVNMERSRKERREIMFMVSVTQGLLFVEALQSHQQGNHAADACIILGSRCGRIAGLSREGRGSLHVAKLIALKEPHGGVFVLCQVHCAFTRIQHLEEKVGHDICVPLIACGEP